MKNTFAVGTPDKVSRAERDGEVHNYKPVIEFDLPKGYSAEDAYWTGKSWITQLTPKEWSKDFRYINMTTIEEHFGIEVPDDDFDYGHLLLLLAVANGHKLE